MKPRILFAGLFHETHTFIEEVTGWDDFTVVCDDAILDRRGDGSPTDGFLSVAARLGWDVIPTIDARAMPSGTVTDEMFERYWAEFRRRAEAALLCPLAGIYLVLHGAMATRTCRDPEGEFLARVRALPGAASVPIFGVLDLHANVSARMCQHANGLVMYRENPHGDARAAAERGAELLGRCLAENRVPHMAWCRPPIVWAPTATGTDADPMRTIQRFARGLEQSRPDVWACNIAAGYSFADTPDTGCSLSLITTASARDAKELLSTGADLAWRLREAGSFDYPSADALVARLTQASAAPGPILLIEPADNIGGGAPGDGTGVLRAVLAHAIHRSLIIINDAEAVRALKHLPIGGRSRLLVGGKGSKLDMGPVTIDATLVSRSDGTFDLEDRQSHLASVNGVHIDMGPCAVVRSAGVTILLTSRKTPPFDLGQLRSQGIEPRAFAVIGVKAAVGHKRAYDPIAAGSYYVDTPGPCTSNLKTLPWQYLQRPVFPLDQLTHPIFKFS